MAAYQLVNVATNKCLDLATLDLGIDVSELQGVNLYNGQNVVARNESANPSQIWIGKSPQSSSEELCCYINSKFRLARGTVTSNGTLTCIKDTSQVKVKISLKDKGFKIQLDGTNLFLAAKSSGEGSQVYWDDGSTNTNQYWTLMAALVIDFGTTAKIYSVRGNQFTGRLSPTEMTANAKYIY